MASTIHLSQVGGDLTSMRIRIPELLEARSLTPYQLSRISKGGISLSTAYRLKRLKGRLKLFDATLLEELCEILQVSPGDLLERSPRKRPGQKK
jgi:DNA-binding Xre family transcriptional regulator